MQREEFDKVMNENHEVIESAAVAAGVSAESLSESLALLCSSFAAAAETIRKAFGRLAELGARVWEQMKDNARKSEEQDKRRKLFKVDFKRPEIRHQVTCRKPKFMVRKIIH